MRVGSCGSLDCASGSSSSFAKPAPRRYISRVQIIDTAFPEVKVLVPRRFGDARGVFCETWSARKLESLGIRAAFVQDNHSISRHKGTVRGLHYQLPPFAQDKLVRVVRGSVLDVAVDIRRGSPTFGKFVADVLSLENWKQMWVPAGFAHGFVTLEDDSEVIYKVTNYYAPQHDRGILWNDPDIAVPWGVEAAAAILSDKDRKHPKLKEAADLF